jgi:hypothetical protein
MKPLLCFLVFDEFFEGRVGLFATTRLRLKVPQYKI